MIELMKLLGELALTPNAQKWNLVQNAFYSCKGRGLLTNEQIKDFSDYYLNPKPSALRQLAEKYSSVQLPTQNITEIYVKSIQVHNDKLRDRTTTV